MKLPRVNTDAGFTRLLRVYFLPHWRIFAIASVFALVTAVAASSYAGIVKFIVDYLVEYASTPMNDDRGIFWLILALLGGVIVRSGSLYGSQILSNTGVQRALVDIQNAQFRALNHGDYARLSADNSGDWVSRFINDTNVLRDAGLRTANNFTKDVLTILACLGWMFYLDWLLTLVIFFIYPIAILPVIALGNRIRKRSKSAQEQVGDLTSLLSESFRSARIVRAFGLEEYQDDRADKGFRERAHLYLKVLTDRAAIDPILEIVGGIALAALLSATAWRISSGDTSLGDFVGIILAIGVASPSVRALGTLNALMQEAGAASDRFFDIVDAPQTVTEPKQPTQIRNLKGEIAFESVSFGYTADQPVLRDVSFIAKPGETVALVGPSGAGKSTLFNLILRLYDPLSGKINLDSVPISNLALTDLRSAMALVSQSPILFDETLEKNIGLGRQAAPAEDIKSAALQAYAHEFVTAMPQGYQTLAGEMGEKLSGGQRQRIALARAFVRKAPILLLDEATSALDAESEAHIQKALDEFSYNRTTLIIAHRLATIKRAEKILVMEAGKIVERGDFDSLIAKDGLFAKLAKLQFA